MPLKSYKIKVLPITKINNPSSVHGIYPYRGKISPLDAASMINQLKVGGKLLDPFCGSGTILYEGVKHGLDVIGVDLNPLAIWLSEAKLSIKEKNKNNINLEINKIIEKAKKCTKILTMDPWALKLFHSKTAKEIMTVVPEFKNMSPYVKASFFGAIALSARGCNHYKWTSSTVGKNITPKKYINFYDKFINKVRKHYLEPGGSGKSKIFLKDARSLSKIIKPKTIDYVFTSPPYFDALDYTAYYGRIIYKILGLDHLNIKNQLIQSVKNYENDMKKVFSELIKVTKNDGLLIFVVGDKKVSGNVINGGKFFSKLLHHEPNLIFERSYSNSSSKIFDSLNKTNRKEQIVVWDKGTWK